MLAESKERALSWEERVGGCNYSATGAQILHSDQNPTQSARQVILWVQAEAGPVFPGSHSMGGWLILFCLWNQQEFWGGIQKCSVAVKFFLQTWIPQTKETIGVSSRHQSLFGDLLWGQGLCSAPGEALLSSVTPSFSKVTGLLCLLLSTAPALTYNWNSHPAKARACS